MEATFIRNAWYVAAWASEVPAGQIISRQILGVPLALYRTESGIIGALEDRCPHRGVPLSLGCVIKDRLRCGYHGLWFDETGHCVEIPGQDKIPPGMKTQSYPVVERDALIWIWCGDPEKADQESIPSFPWHNDPAWPYIPYVQRIACAYNLVVDNLLDQTHLPYVHASTIGGSAMGQATADMDVEKTPRGMRSMRPPETTTPPPAYVAAGIGMVEDQLIDRWSEFEYVAPGTVLQFVGGLPLEARARETGAREGGWALRIMHNITPETETSCHYFWASCNGFKPDQPETTQWLHDQTRETFYDDEIFLEAQQRRITERPGPLIPTRHDIARVVADGAMKKMLKDENR